MGVGTVGLSGIFWIFSFLGIGTQTEVSQALGRQSLRRVAEIGGLALALAVTFGLLLLAAGLALASYFSNGHGGGGYRPRPGHPVPAHPAVGSSGRFVHAGSLRHPARAAGHAQSIVDCADHQCFKYRSGYRSDLWTSVRFQRSVLRGLRWRALSVNGSAPRQRHLFSTAKSGIPGGIRMRDIQRLFHIGGEMFIRTGLATVFFLLTTRVATRIGPDAGAAHQAIRQVWLFTTLLLDSYAVTAQSLVGFFMGPALRGQARRVAYYVFGWSAATGLALALMMVFGQRAVLDAVCTADGCGGVYPGLDCIRRYPAGQCPGLCYRRNSLGYRRFSFPAQCHAGGYTLLRIGCFPARSNPGGCPDVVVGHHLCLDLDTGRVRSPAGVAGGR